MSDASFTEPATRLIDEALTAGFVVTEPQLARWHRAGLLPRPEQQSLGRGKGTRSIYPTGTVQHLLALCRHQRNVRPLPEIAWHLWWEGYPIREATVLEFLGAVAAKFDTQFAVVRSLFRSDARQEREAVMAKLAKERLPPVLAQVRKRTGHPHFPAALEQLLGLLFGETAEITREADEQLLTTTLGLDRAKKDWMARGSVGHLVPGDILPVVSKALRHIGQLRFADIPLRTPYSEITSARDEFRDLIGIVEAVGLVLAQIGGKYAFGLATAARYFQSMDTQLCAFLFLSWCALRQLPEFQQGAAMILNAVDRSEIRQVAAAYQTVRDIRDEIPALRETLADKRIMRALGNRRGMARIRREVEEYARRNPDEIAAFRARRSETCSTPSGTMNSPQAAHSEQAETRRD